MSQEDKIPQRTSCPAYTYKQATKIANDYSKHGGVYWTAIKQEVDTTIRLDPEWCWAYTNKYDPRVAKN